jgi:hypothetical protein
MQIKCAWKDCDVRFAPRNNRHKYCCDRCAGRQKQAKLQKLFKQHYGYSVSAFYKRKKLGPGYQPKLRRPGGRGATLQILVPHRTRDKMKLYPNINWSAVVSDLIGKYLRDTLGEAA